MATRRLFSREFKLEAVKPVVERGLSMAQAAKDLKVHENVLRKWVREAKADPQHAFPGHGVKASMSNSASWRSTEGPGLWR